MQHKQTILIVEDDSGLQKQLKWALKSDYDVLVASNGKDAQQLFLENAPSVVVHDLGLPPDERGVSEGKASIKSMLKAASSTRIIVMTGQGDKKDAIDLISFGAHDFFSKPVEMETLKLIIERAFFLSSLDSHKSEITDTAEDDCLLPGMIGKSEIMQRVASRVNKIAKTSATTFIQGESGTGKELIAKALHEFSPRNGKPFVAINCAAIPESLLESELFGYEKGAFTGAAKRTLGKIEQAQGGTLFLDEIGDMAYDLQSKILRFLQERTIQRVGGEQDIPVDVRIISATHQDLTQMIEDNLFRQDLYYRINEIEISLPPLSERVEDIMLIANHLLEKFSRSHDKRNLSFTSEALSAIQDFEWEGNIRQLSNRINKAVILCDTNLITSDDLDLNSNLEISVPQSEQTLDNIPTLKDAKEQIEINLIIKAMSKNNSVVEIAKILGVTRQRVYGLMKKHGLG